MGSTVVGQQTRDFLSQRGLPLDDEPMLEASEGRFSAGGCFGIELSSINSAEVLRTVLADAKKYSIRVNRCDECRGFARLPKVDIVEMVRHCAGEGIGLLMSIGPRAIYDTGGFVRSTNGRRSGYRLRGMDNVVYAVEEVRRAVDFGVRGFVVYDEGLLTLLNQLRKAGELPARTVFKVSVHMGCSNPLSARVYEDLGADSINPVPDLDLGMLRSMRQAVSCPLDLFSDTAEDAGGMLRTHEVPAFVRVASPVFIKCGAISQSRQNHLPTLDEQRERIRQTACVVETLERHGFGDDQVAPGERTLGVPEC